MILSSTCIITVFRIWCLALIRLAPFFHLMPQSLRQYKALEH